MHTHHIISKFSFPNFINILKLKIDKSIFNFKTFNLSTNEGNLAMNSKQVHVTQSYMYYSVFTL